jgi:dTDP-glucose pyrophosphorylase
MSNFNHFLLDEQATIKQAFETIDKGALKIAIVVNQNKQVIGTISDGDIRRALLKNYTLDDSIENIYFKTPFLANQNDSKQHIIKEAISRQLYQVPVVDKNNYLIDIVDIAKALKTRKRKNKVILMAGGLGTRLHPLTLDTPKPLLKVGDKPILQTIIEKFASSGFEDIILSVNYKANMIKEYFKDGKELGVNISYIQEEKRLGTAGALSLLEDIPKEPFFVMNADLLTNIDFENFLDFHMIQKSLATMAVRDQEYQIPYGVVTTQDSKILSIEEKPTYKYFVNAGIYLLSPEVLKYIPKDTFFDMPTLFDTLIKEQKNILSFPIHEYWLDIGRMEELQKAQNEYFGVFL